MILREAASREKGVRMAGFGVRRFAMLAAIPACIVVLAGCGGGGDEGTAPADTGSTSAASGSGDAGTVPPPPGMQMGGMGSGGADPLSGAPTGMGGMGSGAPMGAMGAGGETAPAAEGPQVTSKPPNPRMDPFAPWWNTVPPPPPAITLVEPYRIATRETGYKPPEQKIEIQETPDQRVAGIATGLGVYALLEGPSGQVVVRPGDMVGDYRVEAIRSRSVILKRVVGNVTYTQEVPLTDVGSTRARSFIGGAPGAPGGSGMMFRGGADMPNRGGGGGGMGEESQL